MNTHTYIHTNTHQSYKHMLACRHARMKIHTHTHTHVHTHACAHTHIAAVAVLWKVMQMSQSTTDVNEYLIEN